MPIIHGDYDYDVHSIEVDEPTLAMIKGGSLVTIDGQGFLNEETGQRCSAADEVTQTA